MGWSLKMITVHVRWQRVEQPTERDSAQPSCTIEGARLYAGRALLPPCHSLRKPITQPV